MIQNDDSDQAVRRMAVSARGDGADYEKLIEIDGIQKQLGTKQEFPLNIEQIRTAKYLRIHMLENQMEMRAVTVSNGVCRSGVFIAKWSVRRKTIGFDIKSHFNLKSPTL